jgi:hypothetical protein
MAKKPSTSEVDPCAAERSRYVWAYDQVDQESQTIMRELALAIKGKLDPAEALQRYKIYQDKRKHFSPKGAMNDRSHQAD